MSLYEILSTAPDLSITIKAGQLLECIDYCINKTRKELEQQITDANTETYPSRKKTAEILGKSLLTLNRWNKSGYLKHIEIGGSRRYRMSDIQKILNSPK
jgi:hypothetical protein